MTRPRSIVIFERLLLASLVAWGVAQAATWDERMALLASNPAISDPASAMAVVGAIVVATTLAVWYFAARRAHVVAKWAAVALAACSAVTLLFSLIAVARGAGSPVGLLSLFASGATVAAAVMLFRSDAQAWFGEDPTDPEPGA